jgi:hypothetical protein
MRRVLTKIAVFASLLVVVSCKRESNESAGKSAASKDDGALLRSGSVIITQADLDYQLREKHAGRSDADSRKGALDELAQRASFTQAALDAGLDSDPVAKAEIAHILTTRLREMELSPALKTAAAELSEARLREIYEAQADRFQSAEKRQIAVLWLNPGADPERLARYQEKLVQAREWLFNNDIKNHPEQGFAELSVDYSEHAASRYKGGVLGWLGHDGGMDTWSKAVAQIAFSLKTPGEVSEVVTRPEGVFLVRYMTLKPAFLRPFEAVADELAQAERQRIRKTVEMEFESAIQKKHPVQWLEQ